MEQWGKIAEDKHSVDYILDYPDGYLTVTFKKDDKNILVTDTFYNGYKRYNCEQVVLTLEDLDWIANKAKELFKGE